MTSGLTGGAERGPRLGAGALWHQLAADLGDALLSPHRALPSACCAPSICAEAKGKPRGVQQRVEGEGEESEGTAGV